MAKKYILRSFKPGHEGHNKVSNTLVSLNSLGLNAQNSLLRNSLASGATETTLNAGGSMLYPYNNDLEANEFSKYRDITKSSGENYAYYEMSYEQRVEYLRMLAQQQTIEFVLDTIVDETIVLDENNYFAHLDLDQLRSNISAGSEVGNELIEVCEKAFRRVYSMYGWDRNNGAWDFLKKFLIEGYLAFEIIFNNLENPTEIIGFKYIDPQTLEPAIDYDTNGNEIKVWYQYRGSSQERCIPDINIIYISWSSAYSGEITRLSYLEGLTRTYNMLSQMENSRLIWNIQNAQKRMKIIVPVGDLSPAKSETLINQIKADWTEETHVDTMSGEVVINGSPQFSFTKTYFFPQRTSGSMTIEEIAPEGYDMSSIDPLKYFWKRFIIESKVPANRFPLDLGGEGSSLNKDDSAITREEYAFGRFINRIRSIFREVLVKPVWIQVCLYLPKLAKSNFLRQAIGVIFNEENLFAEAKERASLKAGAEIIGTLSGIVDPVSNTPMFSIQFLVEKFLNFSQEDKELNEKYKQQEILDKLERAKSIKAHAEYNAQHAEQTPNVSGEDSGDSFNDFGVDNSGGDFGGSDFGGGADTDFGAADFGSGGEDAGGPEI